jgi:hypothetical protein
MAQKVAAKAAPTKIRFCRRGFSPELSVFDDARVTAEAALITSNPWIFDDAKVAAEAAPTGKSFLQEGLSS